MIRHMLGLIALMVVYAGAANAAPCSAPSNIAALLNDAGSRVEAARRQGGSGRLVRDRALDEAAQAQACYVASNGYRPNEPHTGSRGSTPKVRVKAVGYRSCLTAENLGLGHVNGTAVVQGWMNSPGHRQNILLKDLREYGLGVAMLEGRPVWIMVMAKPC